ncbi:hypothetical protein [Pseudonocardia sp. ICBG1034]|uniref:hypothetical protein n=1 Tax=Pseudonocardia sp. ICBG1034 TaxID=2844381 RepID=UPI001CCC375D|nr:hypothetical protein [Pseudonocardia sp. ICBG1034]
MNEHAWWLSMEPLGDDVVWALTLVVDGQAPDGPVDAGLLPRMGFVRRLVTDALPTSEQLAERSWSGALSSRGSECDLAVVLGRRLLPRALRDALLARPAGRHTVSVAVRGWLARVPWDAVAVDDRGDRRLVECATVVAGLPATLQVGRSRLPDAGADGPVLRIVDPGPETHGRLCPRGVGPWWELCDDAEVIHPQRGRFGVAALSRQLTDGRPSRLVYYGHAEPGTDDAPAAAGLVLTGPGRAAELFTAFRWLAEPERFPAPPRIALIACGSDDSAGFEQSGMPVAAINAGAGLVTATRWMLPVDRTRPDTCPTRALGMAVDDAHGSPDPLAALGEWQRARLAAWRAHGAVEDVPLLWASLVTYLAPDAG